MAFVPVPNTVQVESVYEWQGQTVENTAYFELPGVVTLADVGDLLTIVRGRIEEDLMPLLSTSIALVRLVGTLLTAIDSLSLVMGISPPTAGGVTGESAPNNVTYTITFLTPARGRSFRGRNYVPGISNGSINGNDIDATFRTGLLAYYTALQAEAEANGWTMVVVSTVSGGVDRVTGVTTPINGFTTFDFTVDSQRRRLPGRGR